MSVRRHDGEDPIRSLDTVQAVQQTIERKRRRNRGTIVAVIIVLLLAPHQHAEHA